MVCGICGNKLKKNVNFCGICGQKIETPGTQCGHVLYRMSQFFDHCHVGRCNLICLKTFLNISVFGCVEKYQGRDKIYEHD